jgi:hypothetical protein
MSLRNRPYTGSGKGVFGQKNGEKRKSVFGHGNLIKELELYSPLDYKNSLRMCPSTFGELLELITPLVQREDTNMREAISLKLANMSIHVSNRCTTPLLHNEIQT